MSLPSSSTEDSTNSMSNTDSIGESDSSNTSNKALIKELIESFVNELDSTKIDESKMDITIPDCLEGLSEEDKYIYGCYNGIARNHENYFKARSRLFSKLKPLCPEEECDFDSEELTTIPFATIQDAAACVGCSSKTVYDVLASVNFEVDGKKMVLSPYAPNVAKAITNAVKEYSVLHPNLKPAEVMTEFGLNCELKVFVRLLKKYGFNYPKYIRKSGVRDEFLPIRLQWCKKALPLMKVVAAETIMKQRDLESQKSSNETTPCHLGDFVDIFKKLFESKVYDEKLIKNVSLIFPLFSPTFSNVNGVDYGKSRHGATNQNDNHQSSHSKEEIIISHQRQAKMERILNDLMIYDIKYWDDIEATLFEDDEYGYGSACGHPYGYGQRQFYGYGFGNPPAYGYDESDDEDGYDEEEKKEEEIDFELEEVLYMIVNGPKEDFIEERIIEAIDNNEDQQNNYEQQHKRQKLGGESSNNKTNDFQYKMELVFVNRFIQPKLYNISFFNIHKRSIEEYLELCVAIYDSEIRVYGAPIDMWHTSSDLQLQALIFAQILSGGSNPPNNLNPSDILINFTKKFSKLSNAIEEVDLKENESLKLTDEDKAKAKGEIFNKFITENIDDLFDHFVDNYKNYSKDNLNFLPFWAPFSPDLDPIAHIWWFLKRLTYRRMVLEIDINRNHESPIELLKKCIKEACNDLSPHIIIKIFLGTSKRIQEAINEDGGHIRD